MTQRWGGIRPTTPYLEGVVDGVVGHIAVAGHQLAGHVPVDRVPPQDPQLPHLPQLGMLHLEGGESLPEVCRESLVP